MYIKRLTEVGSRRPRADGTLTPRSKVITVPKPWLDAIGNRYGKGVEFVTLDIAGDRIVLRPFFPEPQGG